LLLIAAKSGQNENVKILLEQKLETSLHAQEQEIRAQDLAWQSNHYDIVLTLMKAGLTYPKDFTISECSNELRKFCTTSEELHLAVDARNKNKINEIISQSEKLHPFYNRSNESAAKTALSNKFIDVYDLLVSRQVFLGRNELLHDFWGIFSEYEREQLRKIHFKNSVHLPEKHLNDLVNCSSVSHDDSNVRSNINLVQYAFGILNQIASIRIILMIVAASKKLKILFDFKSTSVNVVDPTAGSNMRGLFYTKGIICVAAGFLLNQSTENETFGTLSHELCHYAMSLVFRNSARPYRRKDRERRREFAAIVKICKQNRDKEELIDFAFQYPQHMHHAELIVRVPHLIALYHNQPEKLKESRENFTELFNFYEQKVIPDMECALPRIEKEIERMDKKILKNKIISVVTIVLAIIVVIAGFFIVRHIFDQSFYDFSKLSRSDQIKIENSLVIYKNNLIKFQDLFPPNSLAYCNLTSEHIGMIFEEKQLNFNDKHLHYLNILIIHNWTNLSVRLKNVILDSNLLFQNVSIKFRNLFNITPDSFSSLTSAQIDDILDGKIMTIANSEDNNIEYYIERLFLDADIYAIFYSYKNLNISKWNISEEKFLEYYKNFINRPFAEYSNDVYNILKNEDFKKTLRFELDSEFGPLLSYTSFQNNDDKILSNVENNKSLLLCSQSGTGKTTTFIKMSNILKKKMLMKWILYIDMKNFKNYYKDQLSAEDLLLKISGLDIKYQFERDVFKNFFKFGGIILFWDGFDEISPKYEQYLLSVLNFINKNTSNIQFVSTRPLYCKCLSDAFQLRPYTLIALNNVEQERLLKNSLVSRHIDEQEIDELRSKINNTIDILNLQSIHQVAKLTPLMLDMIADLIANEFKTSESLNFYEMFQKLIEKKIEIWQNNTEFSSRFLTFFLIKYRVFDLMKVFQMYALKNELRSIDSYSHLIGKKLEIMIQKIPKELTYEQISRTGILFIDSADQFEFTHKTFSDFFIAQFFIDNIYDENILKSKDLNLIIELFFTVTKEYGRNQFMITNFISHFLQTKAANESFSFNQDVVDLLKTNFKNIFVDLLFTLDLNHFEFLFKFFKKDEKVLFDLIKVDDNETLFTASFDFANEYFGFLYLNRYLLKDLGRKYLPSEKFEKFLHGKNQKGIIMYGMYCFYRYKHVKLHHDEYKLDEKILQQEDSFSALRNILKGLTKDEHIEFILSPHGLLGNTDIRFFKQQLFWYLYLEKHSLTKDQKITIFSNLFHGLTKFKVDLNYLHYLLTKTETLFNNSEIYEIFSKRNILHVAVHNNEYFTPLWKFFTNHTMRNQRQNILMKKVKIGCNLLFGKNYCKARRDCSHYPPQNLLQIALNPTSSYINGNPNKSFETVKNLYINYFNRTENQKIISNSIETLPYLIYSHSVDACRKFALYLNDLFKDEELLLEKIILAKIRPTNYSIFEFMENDEFNKELSYFSELLNSN